MLVYRIEHKVDCCGPYQETFHWRLFRPCRDKSCRKLAERLQAAHRHLPGAYRYGHFCGTSDIDSLYNWFSGFLKSLHDCGYVIRIYQADHVIDRDNQVLFPIDSELVDEIAIEYEKDQENNSGG